MFAAPRASEKDETVNDDDLELIADFKTESLEHFEQVEPLFLEIEEADEERRNEVVNGIFRAVHSVKGAAGFLGLTLIQDLAHASESLLMKVRDGELEYRPEMTDVLLSALDKLGSFVEALPEELELSIEENLEDLQRMASASGPEAPTADPAQETPPVTNDDLEPEESDTCLAPAADGPVAQLLGSAPQGALEDVKRFGHRLFFISFPIEEGHDPEAADLLRSAGEATGKVLAEQSDDDSLCFLIESVLEARLLAPELGVEEESLEQLDLESLSQEASPSPPQEEGTAQPDAPSDDAKKEAPANGKPQRAAEATETIRVSVRLLDQLMDLAGELVLARNQLVSQLRDTEDTNLRGVLQNIDLVTSELQGDIMNTRMQPVGSVFKRFNRVVRDMSRNLGKRVELELEGSDVDLDKSIIEMLGDPLTHLVRNALDHGIEVPADRAAVGKSETAILKLRAFHENGLVNIEVVDDGNGIDPAKMRDSAVAKGILDREGADQLSNQDAVMLIFAAGFSTAAKVTDVSGRGVGMDVVKSNIEALGGKVDVESEKGKGTKIRIRLPLTLAILPTLIVGVGDERFAIPQVNLVEVVSVHMEDEPQRIESLRGAVTLRHRGGLLPLVWLADVLDIPGVRRGPETEPVQESDASDYNPTPPVNILVLRVDQNQYGLVVDLIHDTEEIVVKPLSETLKVCRSFAGATIMGDGRVAMILDVASVAANANLLFNELQQEASERHSAATGNSEMREVLLFTSSPGDQFAVELDQIVRLERIGNDQIERVGGQEFMQYGDGGMPLVRLEDRLTVGAFEPAGENLFVLIPRVEGVQTGILAREVVDTVRTDVVLEHEDSDGPAVAGRAVVGGRLTMFLNAGPLLGVSTEATL